MCPRKWALNTKERKIDISVLKCNRSESQVEFVYTAEEIYKRTVDIISRLSARYSRLVGNDIVETAMKVLQECNIANNFYPSDEATLEKRKTHLRVAKGYLKSLDYTLSYCYDILMLNPQGAFTNAKGETLPSSKAKDKINKSSQTLGELISKEYELISKRIKNDKVKG